MKFSINLKLKKPKYIANRDIHDTHAFFKEGEVFVFEKQDEIGWIEIRHLKNKIALRFHKNSQFSTYFDVIPNENQS